jgi:formylglycine-generating enzyme required for sulfatase activity
MGSPYEEVGRFGVETPHRVTLTRAYDISVYEVTQLQFEEFLGYRPSRTADCDDCPAMYVDWFQAAAFANAVSEAMGVETCYACERAGSWVICTALGNPYECEGYRLPTEAEWEYAARGGTESAFSNGGNLVELDSYRVSCHEPTILDNGEDLSDISVYCVEGRRSAAVGTKRANPYGLHDMHGNALEWCHDGWDGSAYEGWTVEDPWEDPIPGSGRVLRGGSYAYWPEYQRSAYRSACDAWRECGGIRLVRSYP